MFFLLVYIREEMKKTLLVSVGSRGFECCDAKSKSINCHCMSYIIEFRESVLISNMSELSDLMSEHAPLAALNLVYLVTGVTMQHSQSHPGNPEGCCALTTLKSIAKYPATRLWDTLTEHFLIFWGTSLLKCHSTCITFCWSPSQNSFSGDSIWGFRIFKDLLNN